MIVPWGKSWILGNVMSQRVRIVGGSSGGSVQFRGSVQRFRLEVQFIGSVQRFIQLGGSVQRFSPEVQSRGSDQIRGSVQRDQFRGHLRGSVQRGSSEVRFRSEVQFRALLQRFSSDGQFTSSDILFRGSVQR